MKFIFQILIPLSILLTACGNVSVNQNTKAELTQRVSSNADKLLRHVVLFNFNESATEDIIENLEQAFAALPDQIEEIHDFEWGINNSPEGLDKEFTHCFLLSFLTEEDRTKYLPHSAHQKFVDLIGPYVEDVTVVDYWTNK